jgi:hypothetical protein
MRACASSKTSPSPSQSYVSGAGKKKKSGWPSLRFFRNKGSSEHSLEENYEKAQMAERIKKWQQESSRDEIYPSMTEDVDVIKDDDTLAPKHAGSRRGQSSESSKDSEKRRNRSRTPTSTDDSTPAPELRPKQWHDDLVPLAINQGLHSLWEEGTKHLPPWLNINRRGPASSDPTQFLNLPICSGERR